MTKPYTVLLLYPLVMQVDDGDDASIVSQSLGFWQPTMTYIAWVEAPNPERAIHAARKEAAAAQSPNRKMADFGVLGVFNGHMDDHNPKLPRIHRTVPVVCDA